MRYVHSRRPCRAQNRQAVVEIVIGKAGDRITLECLAENTGMHTLIQQGHKSKGVERNSDGIMREYAAGEMGVNTTRGTWVLIESERRESGHLKTNAEMVLVTNEHLLFQRLR